MQLPPFSLERFFARHEFSARHLLCASDCETMSIRELLGMVPGAAEAFGALRLGYTESQGSPSLRAAIAGLYESVEPADVLVTSGAEEAIFLFMHAALTPGDHLLVHQPCYQSLAEVARSVGCEVTAWQARPESSWVLDPDDLPRLVRANTRAIVVNVPHNPTGFLMAKDAFLRTLDFAESRGIAVFSDEVYRGLEQVPGDRLPAACDVSSLAVSLGVLSKTYGLPGLRIGWTATHNHPLAARMAELKDYTTLCSSAPSEFLSEMALQHAEALAARSRSLIDGNLVLLDAFFARHRDVFTWIRPKAGPVAFPRFLLGGAEGFCRDLVETGVFFWLPAGISEIPGTISASGSGGGACPPRLRSSSPSSSRYRWTAAHLERYFFQMAEGLAEIETALQRGRKVFFLYPHSVLNEDLLIEILSNEYEVYSLRDHEVAAKIAAAFGGSIFFVNIDEELKGLLWEAWIHRLMSSQSTASARIGIMTYNPDPELARKYLMEIGIPCGFIQLKLGLAEGKAIILKTLEANEARGRRRYVRAQCNDQRKASFNVTIRDQHVTGTILDISVAGMTFRLDSAVPLKPQEVLDDVQLRMRGTLCKLRGSYAGAAGGGRSLLMFHESMTDDVRAKIHRFIFGSLQEEMSDFVRGLKAR